MRDEKVEQFFNHLADELWKAAYKMLDIIADYAFYIIAFGVGIRIIRLLLRGESAGLLIIIAAVFIILGLANGRFDLI